MNPVRGTPPGGNPHSMKNGVIQKGRNDTSDGYMVLRLDERVEWMGKQEIENAKIKIKK
ncbi:hypothetical protein ES703_50832 [subsurface metagenome]